MTTGNNNPPKQKRSRASAVKAQESAVEGRAIKRETIDSTSTPLAEVFGGRMEYDNPKVRESLARWLHPLHFGLGSCSFASAINVAVHHEDITAKLLAAVSMLAVALFARRR